MLIKMLLMITNASPSTKVNVWRTNVNGVGYLITPAHVAMFVKEGMWQLSPLLDDFETHDWRIPSSYAQKPSPYSDICWAKVPSNDDVLVLDESEILEPLDVDVYFRQPYDMEGNNIGYASTIGSTKATLYRSPSDGLLESVDIGFRGMSGAMAISANKKVVGMFVKRGTLIDMKKLSPIERVPNEYTYATTSFEKYILEELRILRKAVLTKDDIDELGVVFDARRGIFLPSNRIVHAIRNMKSINVNDIIGKKIRSE